MAGNHLEDLVAEWYAFGGYYVRQNVQVGKRAAGGYECELDVVAFQPETRHLVQIEPSLDCDSWSERERRYEKKFAAGRCHIPKLFAGIDLPSKIEQIALFVYAGRTGRELIAGGKVLLIQDFMEQVLLGLRGRQFRSAAVPESFPLLRTLQFAAQWWPISSSPHQA